MWSAQEVRDSKKTKLNAIYPPCAELEARNSTVGWHWKYKFYFKLCFGRYCIYSHNGYHCIMDTSQFSSQNNKRKFPLNGCITFSPKIVLVILKILKLDGFLISNSLFKQNSNRDWFLLMCTWYAEQLITQYCLNNWLCWWTVFLQWIQICQSIQITWWVWS